MSEHPSNNSLLQFVSEKLDEQESLVISEHVAQCLTCQNNLDTIVDGGYIGEKLRSQDSTSARFNNDQHLSIIEKIAQGGMGIVYRGYDSELKREVAIKVAINSGRSQQEFRFYREAQISSQLQHPGVPPVYRIGRMQDGNQFIAMKLVEGQTLKQKINNLFDFGNLSQRRKLLNVFQKVCQTIAYAHSRGYIHRDLKPENVMVGAFGEVQVMDWGLAKRIGSTESSCDDHESDDCSTSAYETSLGSVLGTPAYMSPQQAAGIDVDQRTDVFALGGILCEILTGKPPFDAATATRAISLASDGDLESAYQQLSNSDADPELVALAKECLSRSPDDRPESAGALDERLKHIFAQKVERVREMELTQARIDARLAVEKKRRRQFFWSAGLIGAILVFTGLATIMFLLERNHRQTEKLNRELEQQAQNVLNERKISAIVGRTMDYCNTAATVEESKAVQQWELARNEIEHARELSNGIDNEQVSDEIEKLREKIAKGTEQAEFRVERNWLNKELESAIDFADQRIKSFDALERNRFHPDALQKIQSAFVTLGVRPLDPVDESLEKLEIIEDPESLLFAMMLWRWQSRCDAVEQGAGNLDAILNWFLELSNHLDDDPIRQRLRELRNRQHRKIAVFEETEKLMSEPEALGSPLTCYLIEDILRTAGRTPNRKEFLARAHLQYPNDFNINWLIGEVHAQPDNGPAGYRIGLRHMLVCFAERPENIGVLTKLAEMYHRLEEEKLAMEFAHRLVELAPEQATNYRILAYIHGKRSEREKAIEYAQKAIELDPNRAEPYLAISRVQWELEQYEAALETVNEFLEIDPKHYYTYYRRGRIYQRMGQLDNALEDGLKALELSPTDPKMLIFAARMYVENSEPDKALELYGAVLKRFPAGQEANLGSAKILIEKKSFNEAKNCLRNIWIYKSSSPEIWRLMIEVLVEQGDLVAALEEAQKMVVECPSDEANELLKEIQARSNDFAGEL